MKKYISILFLLSTFMGVLHHHNDLGQHNYCQICIVQSSIADADTPSDVFYIKELELLSEATRTNLPQFFLTRYTSTFQARAPPLSL